MLRALVRRYESLVTEGKAPCPGWCMVKVSFALQIDSEGQLVQTLDLRHEQVRGKKTVLVPTEKLVPEQTKKSSGIVSQFLCENSTYFLGIDNKGKHDRSEQCFRAAAQLHQEILANCQSKMAQAIKKFFSSWNPKEAEECSALHDDLEEIKKGVNLIFVLDNRFAMEDEEIRLAWEHHRESQENAIKMQCLVTGQERPIARLHPSIKGVRNAQSSGASLISFNAPAYDSYGHKDGQGLNAPVSEYAAFAYTTALNALLGDSRHVKFFGDMTVVYWAEQNSDVYQEFADGFFFQDESTMDDETLEDVFFHLEHGEPFDYHGVSMDYENRFYILGLAPNAARLSVRFFLQATFGDFLQNMKRHMENMELIKPSYNRWKYIPLWKMLLATVSPKSKDKTASPLMTGAVLKAILSGTDYPASLYQYTMLRIRSEQDDAEASPPQYKITYERCAIIKAYLCRNRKKGITVALNDDINDAPYVLGRLFAVLEHIQEKANEGVNTTIKDKYFDSACATPARIFPVLQKLSGHHLRKLELSDKVYFEKKVTYLMGKLDARVSFPTNLRLEEQGMFILGYYHQKQERYTKKEDKKNDGSN